MRQSRPKRGVPGCVIIHPGGYGWCPGCEIILWRRLVFFIGVFINILFGFYLSWNLDLFPGFSDRRADVRRLGGCRRSRDLPGELGCSKRVPVLGCAKSLPCRSFVLNSPENGKKVWCVAELIPLKWALLKSRLGSWSMPCANCKDAPPSPSRPGAWGYMALLTS